MTAQKALAIDLSGSKASLTLREDQYKIAGAFPLLDALEALKWVLCWAAIIESDQDIVPYINFLHIRVRREPSRASAFVNADFAPTPAFVNPKPVAYADKAVTFK